MQYNMKRNPLSGTGKVYSFTLKQTMLSKGWLGSTITIALLLLIGIPLILLAVSAAGSKGKQSDDKTEIHTVFVVDETEGKADYTALQMEEDDPEYISCGSMDAAIGETADKNDCVILRVTDSKGTYMATVYLPQITDISRSRASKLGELVEERFSVILMQKAEISPEGAALLAMPVRTETAAISADAEAESEDRNLIGELIEFIIPYMMLLLVYMMVVLYGQSMANSVMLEKTSKLMETILTAVHPTALMAGKLLATATAAVLQLLIWLFSLIGGMIGGAFFALRMIPDTNSTTVAAINQVTDTFVSFSIPGALMSLLILALGFLLYLSLSAVSGAMASKPEDLSKTNIIYTFILLGSMLLCIASPDKMQAGAEAGELNFISDAAWLRFFPFTSILIVPGKLIMKKLSLGVGWVSIAVLAATVALLVLLAAAIYKMLVLYRGEPPKIKQLIAMLKENRQKKQGD